MLLVAHRLIGWGVQVREHPLLGAACPRPRPVFLVTLLCVSVALEWMTGVRLCSSPLLPAGCCYPLSGMQVLVGTGGRVAGCSGVVVDSVLWWSRVALPLPCWRGVAMLGTGQFLGAWSPGTMILDFTRVAGL